MKAYRIVLEPDDNGTFLVTCPALPEVTTFGETEAESVRNAEAAIEEALAARIARGAAIPKADAGEATASIEATHDSIVKEAVKIFRAQLKALPELKVELYQALAQSGLTRADLARRLDWKRNSVDRLFRLDHASRLDQIEAAAAALGLEVQAHIVEPGRQRA
ncbi:MAG TPA: type II toxin-antitoxin system HicB family antitoxin [Caulobacteraceae bacterium]